MSGEVNRPIAVVTGASAGIGKATARDLVALGWRVIGTGRDPARSSAAIAEIEAAARDGGSFTMLRGDFDAMSQVKRLADEIKALTPRLDVLINNAGGVRDQIIKTADGTEATFAANHLAPFLLTRELMPLLKATAEANRQARVIAVSSSAHRYTPGLDFDDLQSFGLGDANAAYCRAKFANLLFTRELARRAGTDGIIAQAMHPGAVDTNFASHGDDQLQSHMAANPDLVGPEEPAETLVWLATDPEGGRIPGRYFHRKAEEIPADTALDDAAAARLWEESEKLLASLGY